MNFFFSFTLLNTKISKLLSYGTEIMKIPLFEIVSSPSTAIPIKNTSRGGVLSSSSSRGKLQWLSQSESISSSKLISLNQWQSVGSLRAQTGKHRLKQSWQNTLKINWLLDFYQNRKKAQSYARWYSPEWQQLKFLLPITAFYSILINFCTANERRV